MTTQTLSSYTQKNMDELDKDLYKQGKALFDEGKYSEAEPLLKDVLEMNPGYADVLNKLGVITYLKGDLEEAARYLERAVQINPKYTEASLNLAITYNEMNNFKKAQEVFSLAAQIAHPTPTASDPYITGKFADEHYRLGNMYMDFGMVDEAIGEYQKALRLNGNLVDVRTKLGCAYRAKKLYDEAVSELTRAKELNPAFGPAWVQLGLTYYMQGFSGLAIEQWEDALRRIPDLKEAKTYLKLLKEKEQI